MIVNQEVVVHQAVHGYSRGHGPPATSVSLSPDDSDCITQLSDLSGLPVQNEIPSYISCYPLPSRKYYAIGRTWPDHNAPRDGCVLTHTILVPTSAWKARMSASRFLELHSLPERSNLEKFTSTIVVRGNSETGSVLSLSPAEGRI
ncbi:hypothetical protein ACFIOY_32040 [Bradyrhizobium sp. TZ2]